MSKMLTRRAVMFGALVSSAALAVPAIGAVKPVFVRVGSPTLPRFSPAQAIAAHKREYRALCRAARKWDDLWSHPSRPEARVRYAWFLRGRDDNGADIREPLYAYDHRKIDHEFDRNVGIARAFGAQKFDRIEERRSTLHRELTAMIRAQKSFERRVGLPAASAALDVAEAREVRAAVAVLLAVPRTADEARAKAKYLASRAADWLAQDAKIDELARASCEVRS